MTLVEGIHDKINKSCIVLFLNYKQKEKKQKQMENHNITHHTCVKLYVITYNNIPIVRI